MAKDQKLSVSGNRDESTAGRGHPQAAAQPIVNKELKQTNVKRVTTMSHPGMREPRS